MWGSGSLAQSEPAEVALPPMPPAEFKAPTSAASRADTKRRVRVVPALGLREAFTEIEWPEFSHDIRKVFSSQADFDIVDQRDLRKKLLKHCSDVVADYEKKTKKQFRYKDAAFYFTQVCLNAKTQFLVGQPFISEELEPFQGTIRHQLDAGYFNILNLPYRKSSMENEEAVAVYEKSLFGLLKVPYKYSFLITQLLLVVLVVFNFIFFFSRK